MHANQEQGLAHGGPLSVYCYCSFMPSGNTFEHVLCCVPDAGQSAEGPQMSNAVVGEVSDEQGKSR